MYPHWRFYLLLYFGSYWKERLSKLFLTNCYHFTSDDQINQILSFRLGIIRIVSILLVSYVIVAQNTNCNTTVKMLKFAKIALTRFPAIFVSYRFSSFPNQPQITKYR